MTKGARIAEGRTAEVFAWGDRHILKLFRSWCPRTWAEHEARVARAVHQAALPVPAVGDLVEVDGRTGIIYERIAGRSMVREFVSKPWKIVHFAPMLADLH
ncbi:MAG: phosphotransferase family protein, partial [Vicinamibacterales bacterium]